MGAALATITEQYNDYHNDGGQNEIKSPSTTQRALEPLYLCLISSLGFLLASFSTALILDG